VRPTFLPRRLIQIDARYDAVLAEGFPVVLGGNNETLQLARDVDRTNWLTLLGICDEAMAADMGDVTMPAKVQCTSGNEYEMTFTEAGWMIRELRAWGISADANWRRMVKLAKAARNDDELRAIDLSEGWP